MEEAGHKEKEKAEDTGSKYIEELWEIVKRKDDESIQEEIKEKSVNLGETASNLEEERNQEEWMIIFPLNFDQ